MEPIQIDALAGVITGAMDYNYGKEMVSPYPDNQVFTEAYISAYLVRKALK